MTVAEAAIDLLGVGCVPVQVERGGKRTVGTMKALLLDPSQVMAAYQSKPDCDLGIDLRTSRLTDLDLDDREQRNQLDPLLADVVTPTFTSIRGTHFLFAAAPALTTNRNLQTANGIRAELRRNGIVVVPPSTRRAWLPDRSPFEVGNFADLPREIERLFTNAAASTGALSLVKADGEQPILEGERNLTLTRLVGSWFAAGHDEATVQVRALEANRTRCQPPLGIREVHRIVVGIAGREAQTRSGRHRMSGLVRFTVDTAALLDGPASELDAATFGALHRLLYESWRKDGLPPDVSAALRLVGDSPALRDLLAQWFPISADGRRRNLDQELERERLLLACEQKRRAGQLGGQAKAQTSSATASARAHAKAPA